jgi:lipopolysaccharide export LptBFGC system permease protein LptF
MQTVFKVVYSLVVAILFVLTVILGTRTLYAEPEEPQYRYSPGWGGSDPTYCDPDGRCFKAGRELTEADEVSLTQEERTYVQEQQQFAEDRKDYHRNVFIVASVFAVAAAAVGLYLFRRVEAMPLGLLLGGLGVLIFGWVQAADDFGEISMAPLFAVVAAGLAVVLAVGYWFLGLKHSAANGQS